MSSGIGTIDVCKNCGWLVIHGKKCACGTKSSGIASERDF